MIRGSNSIRFFVAWSWSFIIILFIGGCEQLGVNVDQTPSTPLITPPKIQNQVTSSYIASPKANHVPTVIITQTSSITPQLMLPTQTPSPTMSIDEQKANILDLIKTNGKCSLPCFLGITPGITTWETTRNFILSYGVNYSDDLKSDGIHHETGFNTRDLGISMSLEYVEVNGIVEYLDAGFGALNNIFHSPTPINDWTPYKLYTILSNFGPPSQVLLNIYHPNQPTTTTGYELWVMYSKLGMTIVYSGEMLKIEPVYHVCLNSQGNDGIYAVGIFIQSSNFPQLPKVITNQIASARDLAQVTNLSISEFYNTFKQSNTLKCIDSPEKQW